MFSFGRSLTMRKLQIPELGVSKSPTSLNHPKIRRAMPTNFAAKSVPCYLVFVLDDVPQQRATLAEAASEEKKRRE